MMMIIVAGLLILSYHIACLHAATWVSKIITLVTLCVYFIKYCIHFIKQDRVSRTVCVGAQVGMKNNLQT